MNITFMEHERKYMQKQKSNSLKLKAILVTHEMWNECMGNVCILLWDNDLSVNLPFSNLIVCLLKKQLGFLVSYSRADYHKFI